MRNVLLWFPRKYLMLVFLETMYIFGRKSLRYVAMVRNVLLLQYYANKIHVVVHVQKLSAIYKIAVVSLLPLTNYCSAKKK